MPKAANATSGMGGVADERVRDDVARTVNEHASQAVVTDADPQVMPASIEDLFEDTVSVRSVRIGDDELNQVVNLNTAKPEVELETKRAIGASLLWLLTRSACFGDGTSDSSSQHQWSLFLLSSLHG